MIASAALSLTVLALLPPSTAPSPGEHVIARVHGPVLLRAAPDGPELATLAATTAYGSARALAVVGRSGRWLEVATGELPSGDGWIDGRSPRLTFSTTPLELTIRLATRTLELRRGVRTLLRFTVGVGAPATPTPTGRFAVTDELQGPAYGVSYGCCILAISARQTRLPSGWRGGVQIAIHGTDDPSSIGRAESAGCIHAPASGLRYLMKHVPLGTPVTIEQ